MALALDTEQFLLIAQARQGNPQAIAALLQRDLERGGVEVCAWKRGCTLRLELMGSAAVNKPEALAFLHHGLNYLQPEGIDAVHVSLYLSHEDNPRWVERISLRTSPPPQSGGRSERKQIQKSFRRWPMPFWVAIATCATLVGTVWMTVLPYEGIQPSLAEPQRNAKP